MEIQNDVLNVNVFFYRWGGPPIFFNIGLTSLGDFTTIFIILLVRGSCGKLRNKRYPIWCTMSSFRALNTHSPNIRVMWHGICHTCMDRSAFATTTWWTSSYWWTKRDQMRRMNITKWVPTLATMFWQLRQLGFNMANLCPLLGLGRLGSLGLWQTWEAARKDRCI